MTREELIDLCTRGVVAQEHWHDRDSAGAQRQLAEARTLLLSGCAFKLADDPESDKNTLWIKITFEGFDYFEIGELTEESFYIPTDERLNKAKGEDWY